ncbi:copper amine oxidase N-terminal domain-containing protein [Ammoniphilus sp. CFH 90114]|uniref:copper amine oxidase N-terminal domain-containing protein n=1 Tax=Ammoniphilus sp. CFH 90114 TaxID=2493665 RepID=UPI0013E92C77|nr:copper amine oxidase N-terminal domain-containing protein [Ammoniphilus sp. CFH 90114]
MRKCNQFVSVLSIAALLASLAWPSMGQAATAFSVVGVQAINASVTNTDYKDLGDIKLKVPISDLNNDDFFFLRLPADFKFNIPAAADGMTDISGAMVTKPDGSVKPLIEVVGGLNDPWNDGAAQHLSVYQTNHNELKVIVKNVAKAEGAGTDVDTTLKMSLGSVYVPGNADSAIQAVIEGKAGSAFNDQQVIVANRGTGLIDVSVDSLKTIPEGGTGTLDTIRFKEDIPGALMAGSSSLKLRLPFGFEWTETNYPVSFVDGDSGVVGEITARRSSDTRELEIYVPTSTKSASYFTIHHAEIGVQDSSVVKFGDIVMTVSGSSKTNSTSLVIGKYAPYRVIAKTENPKDVLAGRSGSRDPMYTEMGQLVVEEQAPGSLRSGGSIRIELTGGVKWAVDHQSKLIQPPQVNASLSDLQGLEFGEWELLGSSGDTISATIKTTSNGAKGAKLVLNKGLLDIAADVSPTEIRAVLDGTAGVSGDAGVIARVIAPVSMEVPGSFLKPVQGGVQNQTIGDLVVKESVAGAIDASSDSFIRFTFETGIRPNTPDASQIQVDGDLVVESNRAITEKDQEGRWYIQIPVKSSSTVSSTLTLKGVKVTVDRTVPEGGLMVSLSGSMVQTTGVEHVARIAAANVIIPANGNIMKSAIFTIGSTSYTVNGEEKALDEAPFIDRNGRTLVPVRAVAEAFGAVVGWDPKGQVVTILKDGKAISIPVGSYVINIGGVYVQNDSPAINRGGRVFLPLRVIAEALGANVGWDSETQTIYLN